MSLPPGVIVKRHGYYWRPNTEARLMFLGHNRAEAIQTYARYLAGDIEPIGIKRVGDITRIRYNLYHSMRKRAADKNITVMTREQFDHLWERAAGRCEITGIRFSIDRSLDFKRRPWAPSIDRINPKGPYELINCRLICTSLNIAMNEWGEDAFAILARSFLDAKARKVL